MDSLILLKKGFKTQLEFISFRAKIAGLHDGLQGADKP